MERERDGLYASEWISAEINIQKNFGLAPPGPQCVEWSKRKREKERNRNGPNGPAPGPKYGHRD